MIAHRYSDFTIYVPRVHIPDARWLDGRVKWTRPKRGGPISEAGRSRSSGGWGRREGESRSAGRRGWREESAALGLRRVGITPGEKGTLRRGMVRGSRVVWGKAPTLKFNATYLVDYHRGDQTPQVRGVYVNTFILRKPVRYFIFYIYYATKFHDPS